MGSHFIDPVLGFVVGLCGWFFILSEIFVGEAGKCAAQMGGASKYVQESFKTMRYIVTVGWCIYPLGYLFGYLLGSVDSASLNLLYNLADLVNKIAFVCAVWSRPRTRPWRARAVAGEWFGGPVLRRGPRQ